MKSTLKGQLGVWAGWAHLGALSLGRVQALLEASPRLRPGSKQNAASQPRKGFWGWYRLPKGPRSLASILSNLIPDQGQDLGLLLQGLSPRCGPRGPQLPG